MTRTIKAWRCEYGGFDHIVHAATASKARAAHRSELLDVCDGIKFGDIRVTRAKEHDISLPIEHEIVARLSHEERHRILHAYGYAGGHTKPENWGYRSHYCTDVGCSIMANMVRLGIFSGPSGVNRDGGTRGWVGAFWHLTGFGKTVARSMIPSR